MITKSTPEPEIYRTLVAVGHPEIAHTLLDLRMLKDIIVDGRKVTLTLALPFTGIPTKVKKYAFLRRTV